MLARIEGNGVRTIIVETANRFARDLMVQEVGAFSRVRAKVGTVLAARQVNRVSISDRPGGDLSRSCAER
jgi:hypothetical protein